MRGTIASKMGEIQITPDVIAAYAGMTAVECFGIVGMAKVSVQQGLVKLLKRESQSKGILVTMEEDGISLDFHVIVAYGVSIQAVAENLIENVRYKVEEYTGMKAISAVFEGPLMNVPKLYFGSISIRA